MSINNNIRSIVFKILHKKFTLLKQKIFHIKKMFIFNIYYHLLSLRNILLLDFGILLFLLFLLFHSIVIIKILKFHLSNFNFDINNFDLN